MQQVSSNMTGIQMDPEPLHTQQEFHVSQPPSMGNHSRAQCKHFSIQEKKDAVLVREKH
jgi:hypothetical protein